MDVIWKQGANCVKQGSVIAPWCLQGVVNGVYFHVRSIGLVFRQVAAFLHFPLHQHPLRRKTRCHPTPTFLVEFN